MSEASEATFGGEVFNVARGATQYIFPDASFQLQEDVSSRDPDAAPLSEQEQIVWDTQNSYLDQKAEQEWFEDRFVSRPEFQTPAGANYLHNLNPQYYDPAEQEIDEEAERQKHIATILLKGPQTPEDLDMIKAVVRNKYRPKKMPLHEQFSGMKRPPIKRGPLSRIRGRHQLIDHFYNWDVKRADPVAYAGGVFAPNTYWEDFYEALERGDSTDFTL